MLKDVHSLTTTVQNDSKLGMYHVIKSNHSKTTFYETLNATLISDNVENKTTTTVTVLGPDEKYRLEQEEFYKSYDPSVGYHTAAVLGGMLVFLLMYVVYRTKIRKHVLRLIQAIKDQYKLKYKQTELYKQQTEPMKYSFGNDNIGEGGNDNVETGCEVTIKEPSESTIPFQFVSFDSGTLSEHTKVNIKSPCAIGNKKRFILEKALSEDASQLPILVMDMQLATADWVQKQHQFLRPGGIILKVKSDTICPPNNEIYPSASHALNTSNKSHCCTASHHCLNAKRKLLIGGPLHHSLDLNNSMPFLEINDAVPVHLKRSFDHGNRRKIQLKNTKFPSVSSEPPKSPMIKYAKFPSLNSEPKSPLPCQSSVHRYPNHHQQPQHPKRQNSQQQQQLNPKILVSQNSQHQLYPPNSQTQSTMTAQQNNPKGQTQQQPMHITPIIKIQNYDKSQRKSNSIDVKENNDTISSSSSEDPLIYRRSPEPWHPSPTPRQPSPRPHKRGILRREDAIVNPSACQMCERTQALKTTQKHVSLDTGYQLCVPSPSPNTQRLRPPLISTHSIPNMETPL